MDEPKVALLKSLALLAFIAVAVIVIQLLLGR